MSVTIMEVMELTDRW